MNRPYMFYYFVPLITFWFLFVTFFLAIPPRAIIRAQELSSMSGSHLVSNATTLSPVVNVSIRLALMFSVISILHHSETLFSHIFMLAPIRFLFVTSDDSLSEWRFRWEVDRFSAISGCVFGVITAVLRQRSLLPDSDVYHCKPLLSLFLGIGSFVAILGFVLFSLFCSDKVCYFTFLYILF